MENKNLKILFIDDSEMICKIIKTYLEDLGYLVHTSQSGENGIKLFNEIRHDVIITDLKMPGMSGFEVLSYVKYNSPDTPVIIISGGGLIDDVINALHLGAWDYITKPFEDLKIIEYSINKCLEKAELIKKNKQYEKELELLVQSRTNQLEKLNTQLELTVAAVINSLAIITEKKDQYTAGHQERVSSLAVEIAKEMSIPEETIKGIGIASMLHDIGKIYVPAEILTKPAKLDYFELEIIKEHSKIGFDILKDIPFPWPVAQAVLQHHERINGTGYPNGLNDNEIILEAKIIAVADVFEAMSFHRPYREALGLEKAIHEININKGILFDPDCADACIKLCKKENFIEELFIKKPSLYNVLN
jgi:putative nucleotidyltransferase with HDIG domain